MTRRTRLDDELLELLGDDPELLAIADAVAETQRPRRRVRPVGVGAFLAVAAAAAVAFGFWSSNGSSGVSGNTAYAASGGAQRILEMRLGGAGRPLLLRYDRPHGRLVVRDDGRSLSVAAADLPPRAQQLSPALVQQFGASVGPALTLLVEYPARAKAGGLASVAAPVSGHRGLRWVSYRSSLGYDIEVGLNSLMSPVLVVRRGAPDTLRAVSFITTTS